MLDYSFNIRQNEYNKIVMNIYKNKEIVLSSKNIVKIQEDPHCIDLIPFYQEGIPEYEITLRNVNKQANVGLTNKKDKIILKIEDAVPFFFINGEKIKGKYYMDSIDFITVFEHYGIKDFSDT